MPGPGTLPVEPINAGVSSQPLVPTIQPAVTGEAVDRLVNAVHNGFINTQDIVDRIGAVAQSKKRAQLEELNEYVSPGAIQARMAQHQAAGTLANLQTQQAQAQSGLLPSQTELMQTKTAAEQAATIGGAQGLAAFQQYAPWFGESAADYKTQTGAPDFQGMTSRGNQIAAQMGVAQNWIHQITPVSERVKENAAGTKFVQKLNSFGQNVTPPDPESGYRGSPAYWAFAKQLDKILPQFHPMRGLYPMTPAGVEDPEMLGHPQTPTSTHPLSQPANSSTPPVIEPASTGDAVTDASLNYFRQQDALKAAAPVVLPNAAPGPVAPPVIQPTADSAAALPGVPTVEAKGAYQTPTEIKAQLFSDPVYKTFAEQQKYAENFKTIATAIESKPPAKVEINNDIGLAESIIKLYDPQAALREFKWDKLEQAQPWLEKIGAWKSLALREGSFTPESRQRLIKMGDDVVNGMEQSVKGRLQQVQGIAQSSAKIAGQDPTAWTDQTLTPNEKRILAGQPFRPNAAAGAASTITPGGKLVDIPGRGRGYILPGGMFQPVSQ